MGIAKKAFISVGLLGLVLSGVWWCHPLRQLNHEEIEFYGHAVDQFGAPVEGSRVTGSVIYNTGLSSGVKKSTTVTDAQGNFTFTGLAGQSLGIGFAATGYEFPYLHTFFWYSHFEADHKRYHPDRLHPEIFILWKKQGAEPLVVYEREWRFPVNSGPRRIDLVTGKLDGAESDLVVTISRTPLQLRLFEQGYAWNAAIEVTGGGLIRAGKLDYYNLAPESGYVPRFEVMQEAQNYRDAQRGRIKWTWVENFSDDFFISSRNGKNFARIRLRLRPKSENKEGGNEAVFEAEVWLNPNSSRNLEVDPDKKIVPPR